MVSRIRSRLRLAIVGKIAKKTLLQEKYHPKRKEREGALLHCWMVLTEMFNTRFTMVSRRWGSYRTGFETKFRIISFMKISSSLDFLFLVRWYFCVEGKETCWRWGGWGKNVNIIYTCRRKRRPWIGEVPSPVRSTESNSHVFSGGVFCLKMILTMQK